MFPMVEFTVRVFVWSSSDEASAALSNLMISTFVNGMPYAELLLPNNVESCITLCVNHLTNFHTVISCECTQSVSLICRSRSPICRRDCPEVGLELEFVVLLSQCTILCNSCTLGMVSFWSPGFKRVSGPIDLHSRKKSSRRDEIYPVERSEII